MARQTLLRAFILRYKAVKTWHDEDKLLCVDFAKQKAAETTGTCRGRIEAAFRSCT